MRTPTVDASIRPPAVGQVWRRRRNGALCRIALVDEGRREVAKVHGRGAGSKVRTCSWEHLVTEYVLVVPAR